MRSPTFLIGLVALIAASLALIPLRIAGIAPAGFDFVMPLVVLGWMLLDPRPVNRYRWAKSPSISPYSSAPPTDS
ncbi:hypothetical protein [Leucobacter japonicus]|uniref:hypothetical protein n=1 Tax=Leucobacter japonicus TaxID=1461259 RepID=UPI0006A7E2A5|nr:hypothetical protein [Leucobacter japonicus]